MGYRILYSCVSHPGKVRRINQDNYLCGGQYMPSDGSGSDKLLQGVCLPPANPLFGVFDGMGGEQYGEVASFIAARRASRLRIPRDAGEVLPYFCQKANREICDFAAKNGVSSTGTTAAMLLFTKKRIHLCNIGDSKIFRLRKGKLEQLSVDHLCVAPFGAKPALSQNLGLPPEESVIEPFFLKLGYTVGDLYLLCSDGLTDMVPTEEIEKTLSSLPLKSAAQRLLEQALEGGGKDNTTVMLCKIEKEPWRLFHRKPLEKREE